MTEPAPKPPVPQEDNLANDLLSMLTNAGLTPQQKQTVMVQLVPYLVDRDHKILTHGIAAGRASA